MTITRSQAKQITQQVLRSATFDDVNVYVSSSRKGNTRFAANQPTTTGDTQNLSVSVTATLDGRSATVSSNREDRQSLEALVKEAEELARVAPRDPESMPPLGPQRYPSVDASDAKVGAFDAEQRAKVVGQAIGVARSDQLDSAGLVEHDASAVAVANKSGLFGYFPSTGLEFTTTFRTPDGTGSGKVGFAGHSSAGFDAEALAQRAADKARRSKNPKPLDPGEYTVILEPQAVADLMSFFLWSLGKRAADEGRSYFAKTGGGTRLGEPLFDRRIRMWSDPSDPRHPSSPIGSEGLPLGKTVWIENGVLKNLVTSRYWAKTHGGEAVPFPGSLFIAGDKGSVDDLVKNTKRGILVTRFWYNRMLEPQSILVTGMTRDGTFLVENGTIKHAVKNMRYNESPVTLLKNVVAMGTSERTGMDKSLFVVPPMVVEGFHFSSSSDAV